MTSKGSCDWYGAMFARPKSTFCQPFTWVATDNDQIWLPPWDWAKWFWEMFESISTLPNFTFGQIFTTIGTSYNQIWLNQPLIWRDMTS